MPINPKKYVGINSQESQIVRFIGGEEKVYGASLWNLLGHVDAAGNLLLPEIGESLVFDGVRNIPEYPAINDSNPFVHWLRRLAVKNVQFPDLLHIAANLSSSFNGNPYIEEVLFPSLVDFTGTFDSAFNSCKALKRLSFDSLTAINGSMYRAFYGTGVTSASFPELVEVNNPGGAGIREMFYNCSSLASLYMPKLKYIRTVSEYAFYGCALTGVNLPDLEEITGSTSRVMSGAFSANNLTSALFPKLKIISGASAVSYMLAGNPNLVTVDLSALETISGAYALQYMLNNCSSLRTLSFNSLRSVESNNTFASMLNGCTDVTVHFPSNLEAAIGSWSDVVNGFGGTNTTVLFDLLSTGS